MIRVLLADDHRILREGLKKILSETSDIVVAGEAGDGREVLRKARRKEYDLIVMDIGMPGRNGIDTLKLLKAENPNQNVLMLTMYPEDEYAIRAFRAGASGYLAKDTTARELIGAIRRVNAGGRYVSSALAEKLALALTTSSQEELHKRLSDREYAVLCKIASGKTISEIAKEFSLSAKTISTYKAATLQKMGMRTNAQLTHYAIKKGLVD